MISFLFYFSVSDPKRIETLTLNDLAFGIFASSTTSSRLEQMFATWYQDIPNLEIFSVTDLKLDKKSLEKYNNLNANVNIYNYSYQNGSDDWSIAQTYQGFYQNELLRKYPNKKWYIFGDDDTFIYKDSLIQILETVNSSEPHILGRSFLISQEDLLTLENPDPNFQFIHGGSGLCLTKPFGEKILPKHKECANLYPGKVSDLRLMLCLQKFDPDCQKYLSWKDGFNAEHPTQESSVKKPPISYHKIFGKDALQIWNAVHTEWMKGNDRMVVSWVNYTLKDRYFSIDETNVPVGFMFGYKLFIGEDRTSTGIYASTPINPIFDKTNSTILRYHQRFGQYDVYYNCRDDLDDGIFRLSSNNLKSETLFELDVNCPTPIKTSFKKGEIKYNYNL
ncbi:hypothetical protein TVAG_390900 [Trichomonas vaginalis G3]|uniref:N-acetylgalactosaminide beta-1,3-galactosyltransferase n=1 Tax=Trichomonas vaginalis (strain ATCC PRA-98 / G3) TaxID=412133 RepID=A2FE04_TRIV3|nr:fringe-like family [Trichomonas vaginalis G3]EAX96883.1 hypothetical protein TVAG_390900 [Trichomonas vaginalis G3]KAI5534800.1 fringe-like family [Trichomonas vaginalis G3]|eukprot:XP_001309813.1 hypothetical protein [Trichomonas vaginalis G3]